jgi:transketolase
VKAGGNPTTPTGLLIASGSELQLAVKAWETLEGEGIPTRVVSLPSWFVFSRQDEGYRERVLPAAVRARVAVEAGATLGWPRWVGTEGETVGIDHFGASAPAETLFLEFGFTVEAVVERAKEVLSRLRG